MTQVLELVSPSQGCCWLLYGAPLPPERAYTSAGCNGCAAVRRCCARLGCQGVLGGPAGTGAHGRGREVRWATDALSLCPGRPARLLRGACIARSQGRGGRGRRGAAAQRGQHRLRQARVRASLAPRLPELTLLQRSTHCVSASSSGQAVLPGSWQAGLAGRPDSRQCHARLRSSSCTQAAAPSHASAHRPGQAACTHRPTLPLLNPKP